MWYADPGLRNLIDEVNQKIDEMLFSDMVLRQIKIQAKANGLSLSEGLMSIRLHDVRRTLGSYQAINGSSLQIIGQSSGHKSMQSTQVYARLTLEHVRQSVESAANAMFESIL